MHPIQRHLVPALIGLCLALGYLLFRPAQSPSPMAPATASYATAVEEALPAVVDVLSFVAASDSSTAVWKDPLLADYLDRLSVVESAPPRQGSGIVIDTQGHILTNHHVVAGATTIRVRDHFRREQDAMLIGHDPRTDLAVIRVMNPPTRALRLTARTLRVGDTVLAIGNPYGVGQTVTLGIVSALGRSNLGLSDIENHIQTDAAINPGNSGGALVDVEGHLVGVTSGLFSSSGTYQGISFAIPAGPAFDIAHQLIASGQVRHGYLGIELRDLSAEEVGFFGPESAKGFLITRVTPDSPASRADLRGGDVLLAIDGMQPASIRQAYAMIASLQPDTLSTLTLLRRGETQSVTLRLAERTSGPP